MSAQLDKLIATRDDYHEGTISAEEADVTVNFLTVEAIIREADASDLRNKLHAETNAMQKRSLQIHEEHHALMLAQILDSKERVDAYTDAFERIFAALEKAEANDFSAAERINVISQHYEQLKSHIDEAIKSFVDEKFESIAGLFTARHAR